jgi:hypothetical protein
MNERIKELAVQADFMLCEDGHFYSEGQSQKTTDGLQKFAELIVKECVAQIRPMWNQVKEVGAPPGYDYDTFDLAYNDCMNAIKEHFGVEE